MALLKLSGVRKQFGQLVAIDDLSLSVEEGSIHGLVGPNGAGKTTVFNVVSGFAHPSKGEVLWDGENIAGRPAHDVVRRGLVRTFQLTHLLRDGTALENVLLGFHLYRRGSGPTGREGRRAREERALELLRRMAIDHVANELAGDLPHGHQRALGIAIALAAQPRMLLLDEPLTGMTPVEARQTMDRIRSLSETGMSILIVEHNMREVMNACETVTVINFGKKIAEGPPSVVCRDDEVVRAYLGEAFCDA